MRNYLIRIPRLIQKLYSNYSWQIKTNKKEIFLAFDDGPTPEVTPYVLDVLKQLNVKATFFCIGKNIENHPLIFKRIIAEGHSVGNHTNNHLNGWKTNLDLYIDNVMQAQNIIDEHTLVDQKYFRPPYGRITRKQAKVLRQNNFEIVMWSLLSGDFDEDLSVDKCYQNCTSTIKKGDIIVLHDSIKSFDKLKVILPKIIKFYQKSGFELNSIDSR